MDASARGYATAIGKVGFLREDDITSKMKIIAIQEMNEAYGRLLKINVTYLSALTHRMRFR